MSPGSDNDLYEELDYGEDEETNNKCEIINEEVQQAICEKREEEEDGEKLSKLGRFNGDNSGGGRGRNQKRKYISKSTSYETRSHNDRRPSGNGTRSESSGGRNDYFRKSSSWNGGSERNDRKRGSDKEGRWRKCEDGRGRVRFYDASARSDALPKDFQVTLKTKGVISMKEEDILYYSTKYSTIPLAEIDRLFNIGQEQLRKKIDIGRCGKKVNERPIMKLRKEIYHKRFSN